MAFDRFRFVILFLALSVGLSASPACARDGPQAVDTEVILGVDISWSMDEEEQRLQRGGYVAGLTSPEFLAALSSGETGRIALAYMEWAGSQDQQVMMDWTLIDSPQAARAFAEKLAALPYRRARFTSLSGAIDRAMRLYENNGFSGTRLVLDISGDGPNNNGRPVTAARDEALAKGIVINGLPLLIRPSRSGYMDIDNLDEYYAHCVIGGPGSFMIPVRDRKAFIDATRSKLVQEIARLPERPDQAHVMPAAGTSLSSCLIGERLWQERMGN